MQEKWIREDKALIVYVLLLLIKLKNYGFNSVMIRLKTFAFRFTDT